jgi:death-on-curing protein
MFLLQQVLTVHSELIKTYGGSFGVRDLESLQSALNRPFQTFGDNELYPTPQLKAAAVIQSLIINHPFVDGNKRTRYFMARAILLNYNLDITASENEKYDFVISIAEGKLEIEEIEKWFLAHIIKI